MADKLTEFKSACAALPETNRIWPLYGAGFENLGRDDKPIEVPMPSPGPDELLVRHDAVGLCFSDIKIIRMGEDHPRIYRNMRDDPVVQGHEIAMTVVTVGENLKDQYAVGDRFTIQADIFVDGVGYAYGYEIQGGLSLYTIIDQRVLNGDHGNYLLPVQPDTGYAESALTEPWACVIAAYGLTFRTGIKPGGTAWIIGQPGLSGDYTISSGFDAGSHPDRLLLTDVPAPFADWLKKQAAELNIETIEVVDPADPPVGEIDDIVVLGGDPDIIETVSPFLAYHGILAIISDQPLPRKVAVDVGRVHYNRWVYVGGTSADISSAYQDVPVRSALKAGGKAWFVGAGGPMGRMHVQRAIQVEDGPATILCTDISDARLDDLCESFGTEAKARGIDFVCLNPMNKDTYQAGMAAFKESGFDDIVVLAPVVRVIEEAANYLADNGVMNVFAGLARGTLVNINLNDAIFRNTRLIGHSASTIDDLKLMLHQAERGTLSPNQSVAAVGSLNAAKDGLIEVEKADIPGKIVIYPHIKDLPLTILPELKDSLPTVYALLKNGREWTNEAEQEFLRVLLP
ncbi:MAG: alcohol dehydrogenase catalytic domain-containing protein [Anaerolineae bacterium]|nr:alcohol dehydrogenase catalytic domain-containing protein [Anaerolineae bacterium]